MLSFIKAHIGFYVDLPDEWLQEAKDFRIERDKQYTNLYKGKDTDARWVGDLGEKVFDFWIKQMNIQSKWILDDPAGKSDFDINGVQIDIKTVKRQGRPYKYYCAQISAEHLDYPAHELFFLSFEKPLQRMWFLGGINKTEFRKFAKYYGEGEKVHSHYEISEGHAIYNIEISHLIPPLPWLKSIM